MNASFAACAAIVLASVPAIEALAAGRYPLTLEQRLGKQIYKDRDLSIARNQACASCHALHPTRDRDGTRQMAASYVDPRNTRFGTAVSQGSLSGRFGRLNSPSSGYAGFSPPFHRDADEGLYVGGQFWNGRASNLAEQAAMPFVTAHEMGMPSHWAVVTRLQEKQRYVDEFRQVYGLDLAALPSNPDAGADDEAPGDVEDAYARMTDAIAAFEKSRRFHRFTSKFDYVLAGMTEFSELEAKGKQVFDDGQKGNCAACHPSEATTAGDGSLLPPLFTDFTYDNIGLPRNVAIPNDPAPDPGLFGNPLVGSNDPEGLELGKHKVMSLRNIALTPPYGHNGVFATLEEIVHFYNTRDTLGTVPDSSDAGFGVTGWPPPEIADNRNVDELGDLGLSDDDEAALVAFLRTLTDEYPKWGQDPKVPPGTPSPFADTPLPE